MQHVNAEKIEAINRYKKQQLLRNIFIYSLTALTCSSPFWYPPLSSVMKAFPFVSFPKIGYLFFNPKFLFIVGNLIVVFLVGESKILSTTGCSSASDVYYNEYVSRKQSIHGSPNLECKGEKNIVEAFQEKAKSNQEDKMKNEVVEEIAEAEDLDGDQWLSLPTEDINKRDHWLSLPTEEINKRADDFIARVNERRRLEVIQLACSSD